MNNVCLESDHFLAGFGIGRETGMDMSFAFPPPFFGVDKEDAASETSSSTLPLTSLESSLLSLDPRNGWEAESSDNLSLSPPRPQRKPSDPFPSPTMPFTGAPDQPLNHFVSIAFSPHQMSHLPHSPTPIEALHLTPSSLYPYTVMPGHQHQPREAPDQSRKYVRKLLVAKPRSLAQSKKIVRTILQQSSKSVPTGRSSESQEDVQDGASGSCVKRRFCHVCRSAKEVSKVVVCSSGKQSHVFCSSCVRRRLGLEFENLLQLNDWICPKCNDQCPCSKCRKK